MGGVSDAKGATREMPMGVEPGLSAALEAALCGEVVDPGVIGVNFTAGTFPIRARTPGGAFWNNIDGASGEAVPLRDALGAATPARLSFHSASAYAGFSAPKTPNAAVNRLYRAGLVGDDTRAEIRVRLTGIPYPAYDVFVFASADTADRSTLSAGDGRTTFYYRSAGRDNARAGRLLRTLSGDPQAPTEGPMQYQVFRGRSGPDFTLTTGGSRHRVLSNNVFGLQIVRVGPAEEGVMARRMERQHGSPPRSEIVIPFGPGASVRVRYTGHSPDGRPGGGAINIYSGADIALHVNPRPGLGAFVLNSHIQGGWGPEERPEGYPLEEPGEICLSVWAGPDGYHIQASAPGMQRPFQYLYAYRLPEGRETGRLTIDLPGLRAVTVQPEL